PAQLPAGDALARLADWLADPDAKKCGHNLKYDMQVLRGAGLALAGARFDSMLLAWCLAPGRFPPKLDTVAEHYLGHRCIAYEEVAGKGAKQIGFERVPLEKAAPYACEDAEVALRLSLELGERLRAEGRLARHDEIELPLSRVLADMEWKGAKLDCALLAGLSDRFGARIAALEAEIHREAGGAFNIQSPKQLGEVLFERLGLPGGKRTKSGQWATGQEVLEKLADAHPVPKLVLEARALAKLKSTYTDALPRLVHPATGRVHTSYNQAITSTGRLSSSDPNLQNIPIRTPEGREIRKAFIAEDGHVLIAADYSQIELRLMAHFSKDPALMEAFRRGEDIHAATAAEVAGVPLEQVDADMRRRAKIVNFGILYGMSAHGLARQLGVGRSEAKQFLDAWFEKHHKVRAFMDETLARARAQGWVETLLGHRVPLPDINDRNGMRRAYAERTAINAPLQGSAADIIKVAMIRLHARLAESVPGAAMILQVHDELVVEAPADRADAIAAMMREEMEGAVQIEVPLVVDLGMGRNWYEAHRL
ncbi:MAG: DNA polymerase I, partial [Mariprofundaceae bacterium]